MLATMLEIIPLKFHKKRLLDKMIHRIELHQVRAVTPFQGLGESWGEQIRGYSWHLSYHLGLKQSIPFRLDKQMDKS